MQKAHLNSGSCNCFECPFMQLLFFLYNSLYFFNSLYCNDKENILIISLRKAYYTFLTGCVEFNYQFMKWHSKLWRAAGALFLPPSFSDSLGHLGRALATYSVLPLWICILFSASPPAPHENSSSSKGRWKIWLSSEVNPYAFWLLMMGSGVAACDHLTLLMSHLPVPFLCQRNIFFLCCWLCISAYDLIFSFCKVGGF